MVKKETKTEKEKKKLDFLIRHTLQKLSDTTFLENIEKLGFIKKEVPANKLNQINDIFCKRKHKEILGMSCEAVYRDILVFKKENKIIGTAKICFGCNQNIIAGTNVNTEEFGQSGDYGKLYKLLH